jgi:hypothetical protein
VNQEFILGKLSELMGWDDDVSRREFAWLRLMSRMKYDGYQEFLAGMRFIESLTDWLQQFDKPEQRQTAYTFVRQNLVFISLAEMRHLVELFYPETVQPRLIREVAGQCGIPAYRVWADPKATEAYKKLLRKTLFIELSDGGRIDIFRRANAGVIGNEQIVTAPRINEEKWKDLLKDLRTETKDDAARFSFVYLVDDFTASGTTLLRYEEGKWKGKLCRFWEDVSKGGMAKQVFEDDWKLCVHHYISTAQSEVTIRRRDGEVRTAPGLGGWFREIELSSGMALPGEFSVTSAAYPEFGELIQAYYDASIEDEHMKKGGDARYGFGKCGLPLVLEHNTPNNSLALLWAETNGAGAAHAMRPLFRRRQRHS